MVSRKRNELVVKGGLNFSRDQVPKSRSKALYARRRLNAIGHAYIDFAKATKKLFESAFLFRDHNGNGEQEGLAWNLLQESLNELRESGALLSRTDEEACMLAWSAVHGLATLVAQDAILPSQ